MSDPLFLLRTLTLNIFKMYVHTSLNRMNDVTFNQFSGKEKHRTLFRVQFLLHFLLCFELLVSVIHQRIENIEQISEGKLGIER